MGRKGFTFIAILVAAAVAAAVIHYWPELRSWRSRGTLIQGAVIRQSADTHKQQPLGGVRVTLLRGQEILETHSDPSGYFKFAVPGVIWPGQTLEFSFRAQDFEPLDLSIPIRFRSATRQLIIAAMKPVPQVATASTGRPPSIVSNIRVRYTVNSQAEQNIGSAARTFQVVNRGNVPCQKRLPCSPDGSWKAAVDSIEIDAGLGNEFRDARVSCIAGPCPFTRIDSGNPAQGGRTLRVTAEDWSNTATFLLEAEVFHASIISNVRESYPAVFGRTLNFTLPPTAEGVSLEAELDGTPIVFPLSPDLYLDWATCSMRTNSQAGEPSVYQCELKPGYQF